MTTISPLTQAMKITLDLDTVRAIVLLLVRHAAAFQDRLHNGETLDGCDSRDYEEVRAMLHHLTRTQEVKAVRFQADAYHRTRAELNRLVAWASDAN